MELYWGNGRFNMNIHTIFYSICSRAKGVDGVTARVFTVRAESYTLTASFLQLAHYSRKLSEEVRKVFFRNGIIGAVERVG